MIIIGLSNSYQLAKEVARRLNVPYIRAISKFSYDGEMHVNFGENVKGKKVFLFQSFYPNQNNSLIETLFSANLARDLGAREVNLVAPYLPYLREEARTDKFECVSIKNLSVILSNAVDSVLTIDPHVIDLNKYFSIPIHTISSLELIKDYIKKNYGNVVSCNTISSESNTIDVSSLIAGKIKNEWYS